MPAINIKNFSGALPFSNPKLIPENVGTVAENADVSRGRLEALFTAVLANNASVEVLKEPPAGLASYHYLERSPIADDVHDRWYFLDGAQLKVRTGDGTVRNVGVPVFGVPTITSFTAASDTDLSPDILTSDTRYYAFSFVSIYGEEGALSEPVELVAPTGQVFYDGASVTVNMIMPSVPAYINVIRVYRPFGGEWRYVGDINVTSSGSNVPVQFVDSAKDAMLGEVAPNAEWEPPPPLSGFISTSHGYFVGWASNTVYFSEAYLPHAWPKRNAIVLQDNVMAVTETSSGLIVLTNNRVYTITGASPAGSVATPIDTTAPCVDANSAVDVGDSVVYLGRDGLVITDGTQVMPFARDAFPSPIFLRPGTNKIVDATKYNGLYLMILGDTLYAVSAVDGGITTTIPTPDVPKRFVRHTVYKKGFGVEVGNSYTRYVMTAVPDSTGTWRWRSGVLSSPGTRSFSFVRLFGSTVSANATLRLTYTQHFPTGDIATTIVDGPIDDSHSIFTTGVRLPSGIARGVTIELEGTDLVCDGIVLATSGAELKMEDGA